MKTKFLLELILKRFLWPILYLTVYEATCVNRFIYSINEFICHIIYINYIIYFSYKEVFLYELNNTKLHQTLRVIFITNLFSPFLWFFGEVIVCVMSLANTTEQHSHNTWNNNMATVNPVFKGHSDERTPCDQGTLSQNDVLSSQC